MPEAGTFTSEPVGVAWDIIMHWDVTVKALM
jgi:hypothetical protein